MSTPQTLDLTPQILNIKLYAGDGVIFRLVVTDVNDAPVNLTGLIKAQIRLSRASGDPALAEFSADLTDAANGIVMLSLTGEETTALEPPPSLKKFKGVWDIEWHPEGESPRTLVQGNVECYNDVTR